MHKKYIIKYEIVLEGADTLKGKEIKVDKCLSGVQAQVRLEDYLKRKYINFKQLIVNECKEENNFDDIFSQFGDIFGGKGNFNNIFGGK
jgi:hypothetical protein